MFTRNESTGYCPLLKKACIGAACAWHVKVRGVDKNTGADIDTDGCAVAFAPALLIENAAQSRSTSHAVESFRNEMVKSNENLLMLAKVAKPRLKEV